MSSTGRHHRARHLQVQVRAVTGWVHLKTESELEVCSDTDVSARVPERPVMLGCTWRRPPGCRARYRTVDHRRLTPMVSMRSRRMATRSGGIGTMRGDYGREWNGERVGVLLNLGDRLTDVEVGVGADRGGVEDEPDRAGHAARCSVIPNRSRSCS